MSQPIVIFDGQCNLCEFAVGFIIRRDSRGQFLFAAAQSEAGSALQQKHGVDVLGSETMVLVVDDVVYTRSDAALEIAKRLDGAWKILAWAKILPRALRDFVYGVVARNRERWFGRPDKCMLPTPELMSRFLA